VSATTGTSAATTGTSGTASVSGRPVNLRAFPGFGLATVVVLAFLYLPIVVIVVYSFNANRNATLWSGFSTTWYADVFGNNDIQRAAIHSLQVASVATVVSVLLALGAAVGLLRVRGAAQQYAIAIIGAPLIVPEIVIAVATLVMFVTLEVPLGLLTVTLAHIGFCVPFAFLPIRARLADLDRAVFDAAADLGAGESRILWRITIPLLGPGIVSGALLAFIISLDDFLISSFVAGPGATTLPVYIYSQIRNAVTPGINALSTLLLAITLIIVTAAFLIGRPRTRRAVPLPDPLDDPERDLP